MKLKLLALHAMLLAALLVMMAPTQANADSLGCTLVRSKQLRYYTTSRYSAAIAHADNTWSGLGRVSIYKVSSPSSAEVRIYDVNSNVDWWGYTRCGDRDIRMNVYHLGGADGGSLEKSIAAHEFGHALGLGHHNYYNGYKQLMHTCSGCSPVITTPQYHDRQQFYIENP